MVKKVRDEVGCPARVVEFDDVDFDSSALKKAKKHKRKSVDPGMELSMNGGSVGVNGNGHLHDLDDEHEASDVSLKLKKSKKHKEKRKHFEVEVDNSVNGNGNGLENNVNDDDAIGESRRDSKKAKKEKRKHKDKDDKEFSEEFAKNFSAQDIAVDDVDTNSPKKKKKKKSKVVTDENDGEAKQALATDPADTSLKISKKEAKRTLKKKLKKERNRAKKEALRAEKQAKLVPVEAEKPKKRRRGRGRGVNFSDMDDEVFFRTAFGKKFINIYQQEHAFIKSVFDDLPNSMLREKDKDSNELTDIFLLDNDEDDNEDEEEVSAKEQEFLSRWLPKEKGEKPTRTTDTNELRERLHAKIAELQKAKLEKVNPDKKKKKKKRKLEDGDGSEETPNKKSKKAQFISKANPNASKKSSGGGSTGVGSENNTSVNNSEKTPLRKKVVKSDGKVVYSKFDFIAEDKQHAKKGKPKPTDLLKGVQKHENKISKLESLGKKAEAVSIAESQRWISAIRRAQGYKVRDDPTLLKKTIRKQENIKKTSTKKWKERTDRIEKEKEARQQKRKGNIQGRKDEKKSKKLKLLRKRGRIA